MSASLPNGSIISIAATYGSAIPFTALSNAAPPVASSVAHGLLDNDVIEVKSGWGALSDRVVLADQLTVDTFALKGIDATSTTRYPVAGGLGSVRKILTWTQIAQVTESASSGGEQQYVQWVYLEDGVQRQKPTFKNARSLQLTLADDETLPCYPLLRAADDDGLQRAIRVQLPSGGSIYYNMFVSFNDEPKLTANEIMAVVATFSQVARFIRYAAGA